MLKLDSSDIEAVSVLKDGVITDCDRYCHDDGDPNPDNWTKYICHCNRPVVPKVGFTCGCGASVVTVLRTNQYRIEPHFDLEKLTKEIVNDWRNVFC